MSDLFGDSLSGESKLAYATNLKTTLAGSLKLSTDLKVKDLVAQVKWIGTHVKSEYVDELLLLQNHKSVAVRRAVLDTLSIIGNQDTVLKLEFWKGGETDRETLILLNSTIDKLSRQTSDLVKDRETLQVAEFLTTIKQLIGTKNFIVEGEVAEINIYHQVVYFALKDKNNGERLDCMAYYSVLDRLDFTLNEGLSVKVTGKASLAKNSSKLRLNVSFVQLTGEGEFLRNLKILQGKLEKEGLFDPNRKRHLSVLPNKIALLVSSGSAAQSDFIKVLGERRNGIDLSIVPIKTQGDSALKILLNALNYTAQEINNPFSDLFGTQTVIITRGGGSKDDLILFNQEQIVRAIYALPVPSLVAIGHEKDWSLAEMAADQRASTPTQAAIMVTLSKAEVESIINTSKLKIDLWMKQKYDSYEIFTRKQAELISRHISLKIQTVDQVLNNFKNLSVALLQIWQNKTDRLYSNILFHFKSRIEHQYKVLSHTENLNIKLKNSFNLFSNHTNTLIIEIKNLFHLQFESFYQRFRNTTQDIALYDPKNALQRGYAIVKSEKTNQVIEKWTSFNEDSILVTLQDGDRNFGKIE
jgi:exodeoxyribonuclease VII large subunit